MQYFGTFLTLPDMLDLYLLISCIIILLSHAVFLMLSDMLDLYLLLSCIILFLTHAVFFGHARPMFIIILPTRAVFF